MSSHGGARSRSSSRVQCRCWQRRAIMAGASSMTWRSLVLASFVGSVPPALLYALTGAAVADLQNTAVMFGVVLLVAGLFWLAGVLFTQTHQHLKEKQ